ncbi:hypothetical protein Rsub_04069 [Raphidocelis subcapitata]|uniref:FPL domain-containing protein n=1 Tax=Raphidocelis subcapitata TaxID=307507 RepID=A0A2V0P3V1_9CHLO|nr:hypothetical protein Rsub_04069 [Raphidocelis subcapitata]|eukprot:GBF91765.1 hypothetical protein Rsub_04069 [Raphidocelis subcapitata]
MKGFWASLVGGPTSAPRRFTLDELRELYSILIKNPVVTESNRATVVETVRAVAEFMIWGDQNEPRIFDYLLENNIMTYLHKILLQPSNRAGDVAKQVLQTLSIIIQNVRSETAVFFLFSNNHVNNIVDLDFDFDDEEVLGFYVSFLKTISLKLSPLTVHFFLVDAPGRGGASFPLYTRAVRLAHNREGMVRAAVRTITLNVYSVPDEGIRRFVTSPRVDRYFADVAAYLAEQVQLLDRRLSAAEAGGVQALGALDSQMAEVDDVISYCSDTLSIGVPGIAALLAQGLWDAAVSPLLLRPLLAPGAAAAAAAPIPAAGASAVPLSARAAAAAAAAAGSALGGGGGAAVVAAGGGSPRARQGSWGASGDGARPSPRVRPVCAMFVLERIFQLLAHAPLLHQTLLALVCGGPVGGGGGACSCKRTLLEVLGGDQPYPALLALRLFAAIFANRQVSGELLEAVGLQPQRRRLAPRGLDGSDGDGSDGDAGARALVQACLSQLRSGGTNGAVGGSGSNDGGGVPPLVWVLTTVYLPTQQAGDAEEAGSALEGLSLTTALQQCAGGGGGGGSSSKGDAGVRLAAVGGELTAALVRLLAHPALPALGLWLAGWLLFQLLPATPVAVPSQQQQQLEAAGPSTDDGSAADASGSDEEEEEEEEADDDASAAPSEDAAAPRAQSRVLPRSVLPPQPSVSSVLSYGGAGASPAVLTSEQHAAVEAALLEARAGLRGRVGGLWCEALGPMVALEWPSARDALQRPLLRASSEALLSGPHATGPAAAAAAGRGGGGGKGDGLSQSARSALEAYLAVQRVVALLQLRELLTTGAISKAPPIATLTDAELRAADVQEGFTVDLHPGASIPAVVSFTPGLERRVYFSIAGVAPRRGGDGDGGERALLRSLPVTVVADPSPTKPGTGVVLSVAPLLGADPAIDRNVGKWLHVHVRPSVRGLLRVLKAAASKKGGLLNSLRQLADGHWVLAFADAERAAAAKLLVYQHGVTLREAYCRHLEPLCGGAQRRGDGSGGGEAAAQEAGEEQQQQQQQQEEEDEQEQKQDPEGSKEGPGEEDEDEDEEVGAEEAREDGAGK